MFTIRPHNASDYASLPDIDSTERSELNSREQACLDALGELIVERGLHTRFGVTLLHQHFPVNDSEILLETSNLSDRTLLTRPGSKVELLSHQSAFPMSIGIIRLPGSTRAELVGLEYVLAEQHGEIRPVSAEDEVTFEAFAGILEQYDCLNCFGIGLIHDALDTREDEILLESCNQITRELSCTLVDRADVRVGRSIQTFWSWQLVDDGGEALKGCHKQCIKSCTRVCTPGEWGHNQGWHASNHSTVHPWDGKWE